MRSMMKLATRKHDTKVSNAHHLVQRFLAVNPVHDAERWMRSA
jgi:hypothetical protein